MDGGRPFKRPGSGPRPFRGADRFHGLSGYGARRWRIPARRQAEKMFLVAVIGWIVTAVVGLQEGNIDLISYLKIVLVIAAIAAASWGRKAGRPVALTPEKRDMALRLIDEGQGKGVAARMIGVSSATLRRALNGERPRP